MITIKSGRLISMAVWFGGPIIFGVVSLLLGQSIDWDLRNYHYYNPYAYLTDRIDYDFAPAQHQSYLNPLLDIPFYWLAISSPAWIVGIIYGAIAGLNLTLLFFLTQQIVTNLEISQKIIVSLSIALLGCLGPAFLLEIGLDAQDNIVSLLILGGLIFLTPVSGLIKSGQTKTGIIKAICAGILFGLGTGLKPTVATFFLASILALILTLNNLQYQVKLFVYYCAAGAAAILVASGYWMVILWDKFRNPLFPFFNNIFNSPILKPQGFRDERFLPESLWEFVFWPVKFSFNLNHVWEYGGKDFRFLLIYIMLLWLICKYIYLKTKQQSGCVNPTTYQTCIDSNAANYLIFFFTISFLIWVIIFSIYRYLLPLELTAPLVLFIIVDKLQLTKRLANFLLILFSIVLLISIHSPVYWIRAGWSESYVEVNTPTLEDSDNTLVLIIGSDAMSYVIPSFPPKVRFLREEGNMQNLLSENTVASLKNTIINHTMPLYVLFDQYDQSVNIESTSQIFCITVDLNRCQSLHTNMRDHLLLCAASPKSS